jgi:hypothetical protein
MMISTAMKTCATFQPVFMRYKLLWLLLDSRVVDLLMAYNPTFVMLSLEAFIFQ